MKKQITLFTRQEISIIHNEIKSFLDRLKEDYGLAGWSIDSLNFSPYSFTAKISGTVHEHSAFADTWAREESKYFAAKHGLPEDLLQKTFISNGKHYTITRIEARNPKYPIIASCAEDGKPYKFEVLYVKEIFDRSK
jgi:hypothetical protein